MAFAKRFDIPVHEFLPTPTMHTHPISPESNLKPTAFDVEMKDPLEKRTNENVEEEEKATK